MNTTGQTTILIVTEEHLDRARAVPRNKHDNRLCLIGQACIDKFGDEFRSCAGRFIRLGESFDEANGFVSDEIGEYIDKFDGLDIEKNDRWLRAHLPKQFILKGAEAVSE